MQKPLHKHSQAHPNKSNLCSNYLIHDVEQCRRWPCFAPWNQDTEASVARRSSARFGSTRWSQRQLFSPKTLKMLDLLRFAECLGLSRAHRPGRGATCRNMPIRSPNLVAMVATKDTGCAGCGRGESRETQTTQPASNQE